MGDQTTFQLGDTRVAVQTDDLEGQRLFIQTTSQGEALARLLSGGKEPAREDGFFIVPHDLEVDGRLRDLVDLLTAIRWAHPTFTQLLLDLGERGEEPG